MNKLLQKEADAHNARIHYTEDGESMKMIGASGAVYGMFPAPKYPADPESLVKLTVPEWASWTSLKSLMEVDNEILKVSRNERLSEYGREQELVQVKSAAVLAMSAVNNSLNKYVQTMQSEEAARYAVPTINPNDFAGVMRDVEVRNAIRALPREEQFELMRSLNTGADEHMMASVLRSPVRFAELEKFAREGWNDMIDARDPVGRASLDNRKESVDVAKRYIGMSTAMLKPMLKLTKEQIYLASKPQNGAELFDITVHEIAHFERKLAQMA